MGATQISWLAVALLVGFSMRVAAEEQQIRVPEPRSGDPNCHATETSVIERCFGGIGDKCKSQAPPIDFFLSANGIPEAYVQPNCTLRAAVSVGSIMHDNCCVSYPNGINCRGVPDWKEIPGVFTSVPCHREWRKAVYDVLERRYWFETFGPYRGSTGDAGLKTTVPARKAFTYGGFGVQDQPQQWPGPERPATLRLKAPSGQKLEFQDAAFCASGRFRETRRSGAQHWGICQ